MGAAGEKITGAFLALAPGSFPVSDPNNSSAPQMPPLRKDEIKRECQIIALEMPVQKCADAQQSTTRAVESQRQGDSAMSLFAAANLSRANPRAKARFAKLFGFTGPCTDPEFMEHVQGIAEWYWREQIKLREPQPAIIDAHQIELPLGDKR